MNPLFDISVTLHFRIHNSDWFGGAGSIGYSKIALEHAHNLDAADDAYLEEQRAKTAGMCGVDTADVEIITWETYEAEMAEEDDSNEDDF